MTKFYLVGGAVRDKLLGLQPKDIDLVCEASSYGEMLREICNRGGQIYLERPEYFAVRCKMPFGGENHNVDVVLARKDGFYTDGRRPDTVEVGTIYDDLARRDFTVNAMAEDENGNLLDPHNGEQDLRMRLLQCVGDTTQRFQEDSLRILRAMRFHITRGFVLSEDINWNLQRFSILYLLRNASVERIREELYKCFAYDTLGTLSFLADHPVLTNTIFHETTAKGLWLQPTLKK